MAVPLPSPYPMTLATKCRYCGAATEVELGSESDYLMVQVMGTLCQPCYQWSQESDD